mmetsp:Transcript_20532/g.48489  ORF Transcript_20532/g.48489 Transcript_20532/m.48489 type:complete len:219 (+) Transcript_20532:3417-4073(+)
MAYISRTTSSPTLMFCALLIRLIRSRCLVAMPSFARQGHTTKSVAKLPMIQSVCHVNGLYSMVPRSVSRDRPVVVPTAVAAMVTMASLSIIPRLLLCHHLSKQRNKFWQSSTKRAMDTIGMTAKIGLVPPRAFAIGRESNVSKVAERPSRQSTLARTMSLVLHHHLSLNFLTSRSSPSTPIPSMTLTSMESKRLPASRKYTSIKLVSPPSMVSRRQPA